MEADLQRFYNIDLVDLYRGKLSLRKLSILVEHLPSDSCLWAIRREMEPDYNLTDFLIMDLFHAMSGEAHPARKAAGAAITDSKTKQTLAKLQAHQERVGIQATDKE